MVGTIGPLVQGSLSKRRWRIQVTATFVSAFVAGALIVFGALALVGAAARSWNLQPSRRRGGRGPAVPGRTRPRGTAPGSYCPIGLRRQTRGGCCTGDRCWWWRDLGVRHRPGVHHVRVARLDLGAQCC
ncbi:MAG: hypothetical protein U0800_21700 [Isosphaeraceae bacterium]